MYVKCPFQNMFHQRVSGHNPSIFHGGQWLGDVLTAGAKIESSRSRFGEP